MIQRRSKFRYTEYEDKEYAHAFLPDPNTGNVSNNEYASINAELHQIAPHYFWVRAPKGIHKMQYGHDGPYFELWVYDVENPQERMGYAIDTWRDLTTGEPRAYDPRVLDKAALFDQSRWRPEELYVIQNSGWKEAQKLFFEKQSNAKQQFAEDVARAATSDFLAPPVVFQVPVDLTPDSTSATQPEGEKKRRRKAE